MLKEREIILLMGENCFYIENGLIEITEKSVIIKQPLLHVKNNDMGSKVFRIVNNMNDKVVDSYIEHFCLIVIDILKEDTTATLSGKTTSLKHEILKLIVPNRGTRDASNKLIMASEDVKIFMEKIDKIVQKIKFQIIDDFIIQNKFLSNLYGKVFSISDMLQILLKYIESNREKFVTYIDYILNIGLDERENSKPIKMSKQAHTIISMYLIGTKTLSDRIDAKSIYDIVDLRYDEYCRTMIYRYVMENKALKDINSSIMNGEKILYIFLWMESDIKKIYIKYWMDYYLRNRKLMCFDNFKTDVLGYSFTLQRSKFQKDDEKTVEICNRYDDIKVYIDLLYDEYSEKLIEGNKGEVNLAKEKWVIAYIDGTTLKRRIFDFSKIKSDTFRYEIKLYVREELKRKEIYNINTLSLVIESVNFLYDRNKSCNSFASITTGDITAVDNYLQNDLMVKGAHNTVRRRSVNTIGKSMGKLKDITNFLINYYKKNKLQTPLLVSNNFEGISYRNLDAMSKRTEIIPDIIFEQLEDYIDELLPRYQLIYDIFQNTGLRLKSVMRLEEGCIDDSRYEKVKILKYIPFKVENNKKKAGEERCEELIISEELAEKIQKQIDSTKELREKYGLKYIFLSVNSTTGKIRANLNNGESFLLALNRIAKKHSIIDYDGVVWNFTSRQFRKTLVALMIENNATDTEVAYVLGHHSQQTLQRYYKEINEQRIEDLNHEFFKNRFCIDIGEENLSQFSDAEKKCLYIDFITNYRRVPLGYCCKPVNEGPCSKGCGASSCEKCSKICTGKYYLPEWIKLRNDREREIKELENYYIKSDIKSDKYKEYKEYQSLVYDFNLYKDAISKIEGA